MLEGGEEGGREEEEEEEGEGGGEREGEGGEGDVDIDDLFGKRKEEKRTEKRSREEAQQAEKANRPQFKGDRNDLTAVKTGAWIDDGLGGVFNKEGFTGRQTDDGMKIFKAHLFNDKAFGKTKECPFDCQCCFI